MTDSVLSTVTTAVNGKTTIYTTTCPLTFDGNMQSSSLVNMETGSVNSETNSASISFQPGGSQIDGGQVVNTSTNTSPRKTSGAYVSASSDSKVSLSFSATSLAPASVTSHAAASSSSLIEQSVMSASSTSDVFLSFEGKGHRAELGLVGLIIAALPLVV